MTFTQMRLEIRYEDVNFIKLSNSMKQITREWLKDKK